jgi:hypothetical protein
MGPKDAATAAGGCLKLPTLLASLQRSAAVLEEWRATLWINHDKPQSDRLHYAPAYYE